MRREQVLDAALRIICARGYGAASMEAIARETGVAKTVVYEAYGGRAQLLRALLQREERRILSLLLAEPPAGRPGDVLVAWVERGLRAVLERPDEWRLLLTPTAETPDLVREHVEAGRGAVLARLRELLAPLRPPDPELAARALLAVAERTALDVLDGAYPPERALAFTRSILDALHVA